MIFRFEAPPLEMQFPAIESHTQQLEKKIEGEFGKEIKLKLGKVVEGRDLYRLPPLDLLPQLQPLEILDQDLHCLH